MANLSTSLLIAKRGLSLLFVFGITNFFFLCCGNDDKGTSVQDPPTYNVYLSRDLGVNWTGADNGLPPIASITSFTLSGNSLFGNSTYNMYLSQDDGASWSAADNGLPNAPRSMVASNSNKVFVATHSGLYSTPNTSANWSLVQDQILPGNITVLSLSVENNYVFIGTEVGMFKSSDNGVSWSQVQTGFANSFVYPIVESGADIFAGVNGVVIKSTDYGSTWSTILTAAGSSIGAMAINGNSVFVSCYNQTNRQAALYVSHNNGATFNLTNVPLPTDPRLEYYICSISGYQNNIFAGAVNSLMFISRNNGDTWDAASGGGFPTIGTIAAVLIKPDGSIFIAH